jgi:hypothetical protein
MRSSGAWGIYRRGCVRSAWRSIYEAAFLFAKEFAGIM